MAGDKDQQALRLFVAAVDLQKIRDTLGFKSTASAEAAIRRALKASRQGKDHATERDLELERIDALYRAAYPKALNGDLSAIASCNSLSERRMRLLDKPDADDGIVAAFNATVAELDTLGVDAALIAAGRAVARQIDYALRHGTGQEVTKALYLVPHLMNVLREMGATPEARASVKSVAGAVESARPSLADQLEDYLAKLD